MLQDELVSIQKHILGSFKSLTEGICMLSYSVFDLFNMSRESHFKSSSVLSLRERGLRFLIHQQSVQKD